MKILIKDSSILTMDDKKWFIGRGYIYVDQGRIVAVGEDEPQPEFEFADYIIDDRFAVVLPGFTVGLGNIIDYFFRFTEKPVDAKMVSETLSKSDLNALIEVTLASLTASGATSIATLLNSFDLRVVSAIVSAASSSWIRTRVVLLDSGIDLNTLESDIRSALKSSRDPEAVTKNIVSFGLFIRSESTARMLSSITDFAISIYIDSRAQLKPYEISQDLESRNVVAVDPVDTHTKCIFSEVELWRDGCGISPYNPTLLNPRKLLREVYRATNSAEGSITILSSLNPINHNLGSGFVRENAVADVITIDFSEPPYGPIPMSRRAVANEIVNSNFLVKTAIVGGEVVLDGGVLLTVGRESVRRVQNILKDFTH